MGNKEQQEKLLIYSVTASGTKASIKESPSMDDAIETYVDFKELKLESGFCETYKARAEEIASELERALDVKYEAAKGGMS
ncbi:hypothetical protein K8R30_00140 [archaeon]|nr:hypothetical protein [archaeon]